MANLPQYARAALGEKVRVFCKGGCYKTMVHVLRELDLETAKLHQAEDKPYFGYEAVCLKCGHIARDNYNAWRAA